MTEKKKKFNKAEYDADFHKKNYKYFTIGLRCGDDDDVISKLQSVNNRIDYIRQLIRNDIAKKDK